MHVSKTLMIEYLRCNRYAALQELYKQKQDAVVTFDEDATIASLMSLEYEDKKHAILNSMYTDQDEDLIEKEDTNLEIMMPYYQELEMIAGRAIFNRFGGSVITSKETFQQQKLIMEQNGYYFYAFLDAFQKDDKKTRIIEVKATTNRKYLEMTYQDMNDDKQPLFTVSPEGVMEVSKLPLEKQTKSYQTAYKKLLDVTSNEGRYCYDAAYQAYIYLTLHPEQKNSFELYLAVMNRDYVYDGLMIEGKRVYQDDIITFIRLNELLDDLLSVIKEDFQTVISRLDQMNAKEVPLGKHCMRNKTRECPFYGVCSHFIPKERHIFEYIGNHHGFGPKGQKVDVWDYVNDGVVSMLDVPYEMLSRSNNQLQYQAVAHHEPYMNAHRIKAFIKDLKYPIYHLDFESFPSPLPRFKGETPYTQSLFQFSIHIEKTPGRCDLEKDHIEYLASDHNDHRLALVKKMCDVILDDEGSVMVYNESFEKTRLKELALIFPEYKDKLLSIRERVVDLMYFIRGNQKRHKALGLEDQEGINFYDENMAGSYSIKKVLPIFTDISYKTLEEVKHGGDAMKAYSLLPKLSQEQKQSTLLNMTKYCRQDTYAMFKVLEGLRERLYENN
jgi:hypothetical protein